jgi:hypothetical protein
MDLHVISGFLGSGKTTAIVSALRLLSARGVRAGVITNDKGRHLVDTAFLGGEGVPVAEVPGGCFRCNAGDFRACIAQLQQDARPHVLFAESVGSCVDLVGPVLLPPAASADRHADRVTYSVFTDIRLLRRRLLGLALPFSDNICYIFDRQLDEGNLLVLNKADLLAPDEGVRVLSLARRRFPDQLLLLQSSLAPEGVAPWLAALEGGPALPPALKLDYEPYVAGAAELAWLDERLTLIAHGGRTRELVTRLIEAILNGLREASQPVAHLKFLIQGPEGGSKLSFGTLDASDWMGQVPDLSPDPVTLIINARVQMEADRLRAIVGRALAEGLGSTGVTYHTTGATALTPIVPSRAAVAP